MRYEIYLDSFLLECFVWNLCVLELTDREFGEAAGKFRCCICSAMGAILYAFSCVILPRYRIGFLTAILPMHRIAFFAAGFSTVLMVRFSFGTRGFRNFLKVVEVYLKEAILLGGADLLLERVFRFTLAGRLLVVVLLAYGAGRIRNRKRMDSQPLWVVCVKGDIRIRVSAIVDSGNSLTEPISGKPVCVLDRLTAEKIWEEDELYRVIPFRSVGTGRGVLKAYLLPHLYLEQEGPVKELENIYVAISPQDFGKEDSEIHMLIHPALLADGGKRRKERGKRNDHAYCNAKENPVSVGKE